MSRPDKLNQRTPYEELLALPDALVGEILGGQLYTQPRPSGPHGMVEILSPSTAVKDKREKLRLYERHGVAEYLVIDPHEHYAERYRRSPEGGYGFPDILGSLDPLELLLFPGLERRLGELFGWPDDDLEIGEL